ncbi:hypothetical protein ACUNV4_29585 [Granulosicoccus sp. 3-233]|uniref:hypothetical protein n=1 Tax=Granulosicoccus sp. 3-233 TaxID=3417969 RepID=UPI003D32F254
MNRSFRRVLRTLAALCLFVWSASVASATTAEHLSRIPLPFNASIQSVGNNLQHNGQQVSVATFRSAAPLDETVAYYRELWSQERAEGIPGMVENHAGQWLILGQLQNGFQAVLQLNREEHSRSEGFLSVMQLGAAHVSTSSDGLLPGMQRVSTTRSQDGGRVSELSVYLSSEAVEPLSRQLAGFWQSKGWILVSSETYAQNRVLLLNRESAQLEIVISQDSSGGTLVVINEVDDHD